MKFRGGLGAAVGGVVDPLVSRQITTDADGYIADDGGYIPFWWTKTGIIVKWSIFLGILTLFSAYLMIGHIHAKKRMAKGLPPLAYHRWLVSRSQLARSDPRYAYPQPAGFSTYRPQQDYGMYAMPPPVYDPNAPRPPMYAPGGPEGYKIDPDQRGQEQPPAQYQQQPQQHPHQQTGVDEYEAPAGPPPSAMRPQGTGNSNPFR